MAKISLICEQCGGNIILDNSHEIGTCEHCFSQFVIKRDQIVQRITQNITKHVYGYEGKDVEELLTDGYKLLDLNDTGKANAKFKQAINIEPDCWSAWLGYASTGGDRSGHLSMVPAYRRTYNIASTEKQEMDTFVDMVGYLPDRNMRAVFVRAFNVATRKDRHRIFDLVLGVIGCDDSEIAALAVDLCPDDWRAYLALAKFRQIRARWCELEGGFFTGKHLPAHGMEVLNIFLRAYRLAKNESPQAKEAVLNYINTMANDNSYRIFYKELCNHIKREG